MVTSCALVNCISHFLLTDLFLPLLKRSAPARIVNVALGAQYPIDFNDPQIQQNYINIAAPGRIEHGEFEQRTAARAPVELFCIYLISFS